MNLLNTLQQQAMQALGAQSSPMLQAVVKLVEQFGGFQGLLAQFEQKGFSNLVQSWLSTGGNLPISAEQLTSVLGQEKLQNLAQAVGLNPDTLKTQLAEYLPQVVDKLTPNGQLPSASSMGLTDMAKILGGFLKG